MFKGIIGDVVDTVKEFEDRTTWLRRLDALCIVLSKWTKEKVGVAVDFQAQTVAMRERNGVDDSEEYKQNVLNDLQFARGRFISNGFEYLIFIYDKYEPWLHTPEYDPNPINTTAFTNIGDTTVVGYIEPGAIGDPEDEIQRVLSVSISLELLHMLLYRKQALAGRRPDPKYFDDAVHLAYHNQQFEIFEGYVFLKVPEEP